MISVRRLGLASFKCGTVAAIVAAVYACGGSSDSEGSGGSSTGGAAGAATGGGGSGGGGTGGGGTGGGGSGGGGAGGTAGAGAGGVGGIGGDGGMSGGGGQACMSDVYGPGDLVYVNYEQFNPIINSTCTGTNHQDIQGVEKVVFLGDSITEGTFPTPGDKVYRVLLSGMLQQKWPGVEITECAENGARVDDFLTGGQQIPKCFPGPEQKKTLIVITMGGNDLANMATGKKPWSEAEPQIAQVMVDMRAAVDWLKDPVNFPNGSYVVFSNVYEFTDLTANMSSCPTGALAGFVGEWLAGTVAITTMREGYMKIAVDTQTDMMFLGEAFCGHGYNAGDATLQCYRGPGTANWFDITCIHPTPEGHAQVANLFKAVIDE